MKVKKLILFAVFLLGIIQGAFVIDLGIVTSLRGFCSYLLVITVLLIYRKLDVRSDFAYIKIMYFYLILGIISIIRGFFEAQNYWDWKFLIFDTSLLMLMPFVGFVGSNKNVVQAILYNYIRYLIPVSFLVYFASLYSENTDGYTRFLSPLYLCLLFFPLLKKKWKLILILLVILSIFSAIATRSNIIRYTVVFCLILIYYIRFLFRKRLLEIMRVILFVIPIALFTLAITDIFNIFKMGESYSDKYVVKSEMKGVEQESDMVADTRTFIYEEEISSSIQRGTYLFGESAVGGYLSDIFVDDVFTSKGRPSSEVGILNIFNYLGIIGVIGYTLIYFFASYLSINRSNNDICKLIGLFIAFRWTYSWIEEFSNFDMNYFFLWLTIGLCFSKSFRELNNQELKVWVLGIFDRRYIKNNSFV